MTVDPSLSKLSTAATAAAVAPAATAAAAALAAAAAAPAATAGVAAGVPADPAASPPAGLRCRLCGTGHRAVTLVTHEAARCRRCDAVLQRHVLLDDRTVYVLGVSALVLFVVANLAPLVVVESQGVRNEATLVRAVWALADGETAPMALVAALILIAAPALELLLRTWLLSHRAALAPAPVRARVRRALAQVAPWSMTEVCFLALLISAIKLSAYLSVTAGVGTLAYAGFTVLMLVIAAHAGHGAPQGHATRRRSAAMAARQRQAAWALLLAALVCYVPANVLPVLTTWAPGGPQDSTIVAGVVEFWNAGDPGIAVIIFTASVLVPCTKFVVLLVLLTASRAADDAARRARTTLFRVLEFIGYWSMLDVIVVALVAAAAHFNIYARAEPRAGILFFGLTVILTMLATKCLDPREIWADAPADGADGRLAADAATGARR